MDTNATPDKVYSFFVFTECLNIYDCLLAWLSLISLRLQYAYMLPMWVTEEAYNSINGGMQNCLPGLNDMAGQQRPNLQRIL